MVKQSASQAFGRSCTAPRAARTFLAETLSSWHRPLDRDAEVIVAELVANGVTHATTGAIDVSFELVGDSLRINVTDRAPDLLPQRDAPRGEHGGFGLNLVDSLTHAWGCETGRDTKTIWAELDLDHPVL